MKYNNVSDIYFAIDNCYLGKILVAQSQKGICAIFFGDNAEQLQEELIKYFPHATLDSEKTNLLAQLIDNLDKPAASCNFPLDIQGTWFQQKVWQALVEIPIGKTASYSEIAKRINAPNAVRAVARACGSNLISFVIPCHRVIGSNGTLTGYRWGLNYKRLLLDRELNSGSFAAC